MHRLSTLTSLYEHAKAERQNGNSDLNITPYYFSVDDKGKVRESNSAITILSAKPVYIMCCTVNNYQYYGPRKDAQIFCFINQVGDIMSEISLNTWSLSGISTHSIHFVEGATFNLVEDFSQKFEFLVKARTPLDNMQLLWKFLEGLDKHCKTVKEAEFYYDYFIKTLELDEANLSIEDYKQRLIDKSDMIKQHEDLLERIKALLPK